VHESCADSSASLGCASIEVTNLQQRSTARLGPCPPGRETEDDRLSDTDAIATALAYQNGIAVLKVGGEIDLATVPALEAAIEEALIPRPTGLVIDLSEVGFLASAGLQALVATHNNVSRSAHFAVVANSASTSRPIQLTGLDQIFALYPTLGEALTAVQNNSK
jgi:anti-sigma B factor antagonist